MKKEYVEPKVKAMEIGCSGMLCTSDPETSDMDVHNEYISGDAL